MQGAFARKKEAPAVFGGAHLPQANREHKPAEAAHAPAVSPFDSSVLMAEKKAPQARPIPVSMSEGPMQLRESQNVEQHGRASFEKSVKVEIDAMKARIMAKLAANKKKKGKKGKDGKKKDDGK
ncbi:MAG: hypothetical protein WCY41_04830 [Candidatus Micrarchaeia archaeon]